MTNPPPQRDGQLPHGSALSGTGRTGIPQMLAAAGLAVLCALIACAGSSLTNGSLSQDVQSGPQPLNCNSMATATYDQLGPLKSGCAKDADCKLVTVSLSCFSGCPQAILASRAIDLSSQLAIIDGLYCEDAGCLASADCASP